jgi:hypothetical protein
LVSFQDRNNNKEKGSWLGNKYIQKEAELLISILDRISNFRIIRDGKKKQKNFNMADQIKRK